MSPTGLGFAEWGVYGTWQPERSQLNAASTEETGIPSSCATWPYKG